MATTTSQQAVPVPARHPVTRLAHAVLAWSEREPDNPAMSDGITTWTYGLLAEAVAEGVALMRTQQVRPGDRVLLIGENGLALAAMILAAGAMDVLAVLENARRAPREVDLIRDHCQARRVLYLSGNSPDAGAHAARHGAEVCSTRLLGELAIGSLNETAEPEPVRKAAEDQVAVIIYTTGTTGVPKGVMLSHANLLYLAGMMVKLRRMVPQDRVYGVLPITHVMGLAAVLSGSLCAGAHLHIVARFDPDHCARALREQGITVMQGAPAMFAKLVDYAKEHPLDAPCLRFIAAGGAPIDPTAKQEAEALFGLTLHNGYGLTEGSGLCWTRLDMPRIDCSVGMPLPGVELKVLDESGAPVAPGKVGVLWARGPNVMMGYFRNPTLTAEAMQPGGWFNTQDLARIADDGHVFIEGRAKDLIISSGFNVYPLEVENALNAHPHIVHSAVLGRAACGNEEVVAFIELATGKELTLGQLNAFLAERISPYKRPREVYVMQTLPTSPNGKVLKNSLKELACRNEQHAASGVTRLT